MGALVLILVLVVSQASASAKLTLQAEEEALLETSDMVEIASEEMKAQRKKQQEAIDNRRSQLAGIENHISRLIEELKQIDQTKEAIQQQSTQTDQQRTEQAQRMHELEQQLHKETEKLEEVRSKAENSMPAFAILPYQGNRGTTRRPIYLECTQRGVVIQPEGVVISIEDLKPPHGPGNPLDASLRLIRSTYQRLDPTASSTVSPYPLLLVRPDGIKAYVLARAAMNGWDDQFGYELIDQNMPLAFPPTIPGMSKQLVENLNVARQRQSALIAAMPRRYGSENEWDEALDSIDRGVGDGSTELLSGSRRSSGNDWSAIDHEIANSNDQAPWKMIANLPNAPGRNASDVSTSSIPNSNDPTIDYSQQGSRPNPANGPTATFQDLRSMQQASRDGLLESQGPLSANRAMSIAGDGLQAPVGGEQSALESDGFNPPNATNASQASKSSPANLSARASQSSGIQPFQTGQASNTQSPGSQGGAPSFSTQSIPSDQVTTQSVSPASERNPGEQSPSIDISPRRPSQRSSNDSKKVASAPVRTWTTSHRHVNGTMVSRPMTIVAMSDRWLIMRDDAPNQVERVIPLQVGPSAAGQQLETAINDRVESWGIAVSNGYWQPKLTIQFGPDSDNSVQRLRRILDGSGLDMDLQPLR